MMASMDTGIVAERLREWARGVYPVEAGVELLIGHGKAINDGAPWVLAEGSQVWVNTELLFAEAGAWSTGFQAAADARGGRADKYEDPGALLGNVHSELHPLDDSDTQQAANFLVNPRIEGSKPSCRHPAMGTLRS